MSVHTDGGLQAFWHQAQQRPECATSRFWEYYFKRSVFRDEDWAISSRLPPTMDPADDRWIDIMVERVRWDHATAALLVVEAKRTADDASPFRTDDVEYQAFAAACAYALSAGSFEPIWAMTCVGTAARFWVFHPQAAYLIPYAPWAGSIAGQDEYLEISQHEARILDALMFIRDNPTPPTSLLAVASLPRPTDACLPAHWHDGEVQELDAQRISTPPESVADGRGDDAETDGGADYAPDNRPFFHARVYIVNGSSTKCYVKNKTYFEAPVVDWKPRYMWYDGRERPGYVYRGKKLSFYTWELLRM